MADKSEMELGLASDCAWVRGLDASGNSIRILKEDLVNMMPSLSRAFVAKHFVIRNGDTKVIGKVNGLMSINFPWEDNYISIYSVSSKAKKIDLIHGHGYSFLDFTFNGDQELLVSSRYTGTAGNTGVNMSYQNIIH